ncbi:unnamed protein product [marine sediment metagenome]|uniref:Uncharacterized protein n=1 Tax=marine sediment metagenome TaxID=412755 RepID=X1JRQ7_9ZZZZ
MPKYRTSEAVQTITLAKPINTTTTLEVRGSDDSFASPRTDFSSEEELRVNGTVIATDGADLSATGVQVYIDGSLQYTSQLTFDPSGTNLYVQSIGMIPEGTKEIKVVFPQFRVYLASSARVGMLVSPGEWWSLLQTWQKVVISVGVVAVIAGAGYLILKKKKR